VRGNQPSVLILAVIAILQGALTLLNGIHAARHLRTFRPRRVSRERVVVFCPCKGVDHDFEKNIASLLNQDYPDYEVHFVVESDGDPAFAILQAMGVSVVVAGSATSRGQKVHNLAYAVEHCGEADVYVFCDSDARFPPEWLSRLIAPLDSSNITTGYRWYVPTRFHFPTLMRSAWNASSLNVLGDHNHNFAWGGSTAMHRATFERLNILEAWRGTVSDDYAITRAAQRGGMKIVFVPECLVLSFGECSFGELVEFTTRQIIITRVYHRVLWRIAFAGHLIFNLSFWILLIGRPALWLPVYALSAVQSWIRYRAVDTVLPSQGKTSYAWFYALSSPLVALLYLYNMIASMLTNEIVWRQIRYKLISPTETKRF
jgi:ceramide glucosyltransferase